MKKKITIKIESNEDNNRIEHYVKRFLKGVSDFLKENPREETNLLKNLRINVHARYGENKTSEKIKDEN